jgi:hypothetical protein
MEEWKLGMSSSSTLKSEGPGLKGEEGSVTVLHLSSC